MNWNGIILGSGKSGSITWNSFPGYQENTDRRILEDFLSALVERVGPCYLTRGELDENGFYVFDEDDHYTCNFGLKFLWGESDLLKAYLSWPVYPEGEGDEPLMFNAQFSEIPRVYSDRNHWNFIWTERGVGVTQQQKDRKSRGR